MSIFSRLAGLLGRRKQYWVTERLFDKKRRVAGPFRTREEAEAKRRELDEQRKRDYLDAPIHQTREQMEEHARLAMRDYRVEED